SAVGADEVVVMYAGSVMEQAGRRELFYDYHHPYTSGLLRSVPTFEDAQGGAGRRRLSSIPGQPPSLISLGAGCPFGPRCAHRMSRCRRERPPLTPVGAGSTHLSACWLDGGVAHRGAAEDGAGETLLDGVEAGGQSMPERGAVAGEPASEDGAGERLDGLVAPPPRAAGTTSPEAAHGEPA
ncbi:MAG TPA: oligopeptide/dipeptide ABC transporter ATP-binding protein, partial [Acidimicrobiales bacterium]|nr:oligopeptide/dipeptide ABC transporter ATP-binding protein [Acidimicrobiales bacterium]